MLLRIGLAFLFAIGLLGCSNYDIDPKDDNCVFSYPTFSDDFSDNKWEEINGAVLWQQATWMQNGTRMADDRCNAEGGFLELTVLPGEPYCGGSIQTRWDEWGYGLWEACLKPSEVPGVLNSMFTMDWNGESYEEADIEFLTYTFTENSGYIHLALHRAGENFWEEDVRLAFNPSEDFHVYGIQITADSVSWMVDGDLLKSVFFTDDFSLSAPYQFFFNAWTKEEWINGPPADTAIYKIDWVKFYPYICSD